VVMSQTDWQLLASGETITQGNISRMIPRLSKMQPILADHIALSVLRQN